MANAVIAEQAPDAGRPSMLQHVIERLEPLPGLECFELGRVGRDGIPHGRR